MPLAIFTRGTAKSTCHVMRHNKLHLNYSIKLLVTSGEYVSRPVCLESPAIFGPGVLAHWRVPRTCPHPLPHSTNPSKSDTSNKPMHLIYNKYLISSQRASLYALTNRNSCTSPHNAPWTGEEHVAEAFHSVEHDLEGECSSTMYTFPTVATNVACTLK